MLGFKSDDLLLKSYSGEGMPDADNSISSKLNAFRNNLKPLNKITWEAFNQIAKLSGDVDHEPNTPKSGTNISDDVD